METETRQPVQVLGVTADKEAKFSRRKQYEFSQEVSTSGGRNLGVAIGYPILDGRLGNPMITRNCLNYDRDGRAHAVAMAYPITDGRLGNPMITIVGARDTRESVETNDKLS